MNSRRYSGDHYFVFILLLMVCRISAVATILVHNNFIEDGDEMTELLINLAKMVGSGINMGKRFFQAQGAEYHPSVHVVQINATHLDPVYKYVNKSTDELKLKLDILNQTTLQTKERIAMVEADEEFSRSRIVGVYKGLEEIKAKQEEHSSILEEHSSILKEHSSILEEHSSILKEHSSILEEHSSILEEHSSKLDEISIKLNQISSRLGRLEENSVSRENIKALTEMVGNIWNWLNESNVTFKHSNVSDPS